MTAIHSRAAGVLGLLLLAATSGAQAPSFPVGTERVTVDVMVTDSDGRPVPGLTREDFTVEDEGVRQQIEVFEAIDVTAAAPDEGETGGPAPVATNDDARQPARAFLIVFDDLNLSPASGERVRRALLEFLARSLRETDCVTVAPTGGGAWWSGCLSDGREDLGRALRAMRGRRLPDLTQERISDYEAKRIEVDRDRETLTHVALRFFAFEQGQANAEITSRDRGANQMSGAEAAAPLVRTLAADTYQRARARNETLLRSLERGMRALSGGRGRRVVILASDGFIHDPGLPGFQRVREAARRSNAALYFVDARGLTDDDVGSGKADLPSLPDPENRFGYSLLTREYAAEESAGAESLAADTGGFTVRGSDITPGLWRISAESRVFYLLGYAPSNRGDDGRFRRIRVKVGRPGVKVRARTGYYPGTPAAVATVSGEPPPEVGDALDALIDARGIPLRLASYVLGNAADGRVTVLLSGEADPEAVTLEPKNGRLVGALTSFSTVAARDSGEVARKDLVHDLGLRPEAMTQVATTWLPVAHAYELPPGRYQARLAVQDRASGRTGSVRHTFDVPSPLDLRLATPVLTDVLAPGAGEGAADRPVPVARRAFRAGSRIACGVEVWGGRAAAEASAVELVYEVLRADGSVAARTEPRPVPRDGRGARSDVFKMTLNRPGRYELRVFAHDRATGEDAMAVERFEVTAPPPAG